VITAILKELKEKLFTEFTVLLCLVFYSLIRLGVVKLRKEEKRLRLKLIQKELIIKDIEDTENKNIRIQQEKGRTEA